MKKCPTCGSPRVIAPYAKVLLSDIDLLMAALEDAAENRDSYADSLTDPNGKPLCGHVRRYKRAMKMKRKYLELKEKLSGD